MLTELGYSYTIRRVNKAKLRRKRRRFCTDKGSHNNN